MTNESRKQALTAAKLAVRAYAKDPTDRNAALVRFAWQSVKTLPELPIWRQRSEGWLNSKPGPDDIRGPVVERDSMAGTRRLPHKSRSH
jgi:hypothetical protein